MFTKLYGHHSPTLMMARANFSAKSLCSASGSKEHASVKISGVNSRKSLRENLEDWCMIWVIHSFLNLVDKADGLFSENNT